MCVLSAIWAETAEARLFGRFGGGRRVFSRGCGGMSCGVRSAQRANNFNANQGFCRQLNQVDESADLRECVDSRGNRTLVQNVDMPLDALGRFDLSRERNVEQVRNPFDGSVQFIRRLFIGRDGVVRDRQGFEIDRSYRGGDRVVSGLRSIYQDKYANFRTGSNAERLVSRFLRANGGAISENGIYAIDLDSMPIPQALGGNNMSLPERRRIAVRALNMLLNTVNTNCSIRFEDSDGADGIIDLDYFSRGAPSRDGRSLADCLGSGNQLLFESADPTFGCTNKIRIGNLIAKFMDPDVYYQLLGAPRTKNEFSNITGTRGEIKGSRGNKILIAPPLDGRLEGKDVVDKEGFPVTDNQRIVGWEEKRSGAAPGENCFKSFDFDATKTGKEKQARNVFENGANVNHDAEEILCIGRNGFMQGYIYNPKNNQLLNTAPSEIAHGGVVHRGTITSVVSCLDCHANGFVAGGNATQGPFKDKPYTDHFSKLAEYKADRTGRIGQGFADTFETFFTANSEYKKRADASTQRFRTAMRELNAEVPDIREGKTGGAFPILPEVVKAFNDPLKSEDVTREKSALGSLASFQGQVVDRNVFETQLDNQCSADNRGRGNRGRVDDIDRDRRSNRGFDRDNRTDDRRHDDRNDGRGRGCINGTCPGN